MKITLGRFIAYALVALVVCDIAFLCVLLGDGNPVLAAVLSIVANLGFLLLGVMFPGLCVWKIAGKTQTKKRGLALIPGVWIWVACRIGGISMWWATAAMTGIWITESYVGPNASWLRELSQMTSPIGLATVFLFNYILFSIPKALKVPNPWRWLIVVPGVSFFYMGYLAFRTETPPSEIPLSDPSEQPEAPQAASISTSPDNALPMSVAEDQSTPPALEFDKKEPSSNAKSEVTSMNKKQRLVGTMAAALFALALFFPPWVHTQNGHQIESAGFSCILSPPQPRHQGVQMDTSRLLAECLFILVLGGVSWLWMGRDTGKKSAQESLPPSPAAASRKPISALQEFIRKRWVVSGIITVLFACIIAFTSIAIDQAHTIKPLPKSETPLERAISRAKTDYEWWVQSQMEKETGKLHIIGWQAKRIDDQTYVVTYSFEQSDGVRCDAFEVNFEANIARKIMGDPELERKYGFAGPPVAEPKTNEWAILVEDAPFKPPPVDSLVPGSLTPPGFIEVDVPGFGTVEFPDTLTTNEITAVLRSKFSLKLLSDADVGIVPQKARHYAVKIETNASTPRR